MKQVQDVIERLWDFIDKLDINTFGKSTSLHPNPNISMLLILQFLSEIAYQYSGEGKKIT